MASTSSISSSTSLSTAQDSLVHSRAHHPRRVTFSNGLATKHSIKQVQPEPESHSLFVTCIALAILFIAAAMLCLARCDYEFNALEIALVCKLEVALLATIIHEGMAGHIHS